MHVAMALRFRASGGASVSSFEALELDDDTAFCFARCRGTLDRNHGEIGHYDIGTRTCIACFQEVS